MLIFALGVLASSGTQILLKKAANKKYKGVKVFLNRETIMGYGILFIVTLISAAWLYRHIELSAIALLGSLSYIFIPILSLVFFKEKIKRSQIASIMFIVTGIIVFVLLS
jgi:drug/metabolite transporter (DMT)-like permease